MRVLLCDDHAMVRYGLIQILADEFPGSVFGEAGNADELLASTLTRAWDLVLLDLSMPGRDGLSVLGDLRKRCPNLPVLVVTMHSEDQYALRAIRTGAAGYLNKREAPEELANAVRRILSGGRYIPDAVAQILAAAPSREAKPRLHETLSDRELQVLRMLVSGRMVKEIAAELSLSAKTVSTYHSRILRKLHLKSDADLIRYALEFGLNEPS